MILQGTPRPLIVRLDAKATVCASWVMHCTAASVAQLRGAREPALGTSLGRLRTDVKPPSRAARGVPERAVLCRGAQARSVRVAATQSSRVVFSICSRVLINYSETTRGARWVSCTCCVRGKRHTGTGRRPPERSPGGRRCAGSSVASRRHRSAARAGLAVTAPRIRRPEPPRSRACSVQ